jgi:hypothetical protein
MMMALDDLTSKSHFKNKGKIPNLDLSNVSSQNKKIVMDKNYNKFVEK